MTNKLNKYLTVFDILNQILTVFLTVFSSTNIFAHIKKRIIIIKSKQEIKIKKKKHNKLLYLAKNKLGCIEKLISNSIKDETINHDEFLAILNKKTDYDSLKSKI